MIVRPVSRIVEKIEIEMEESSISLRRHYKDGTVGVLTRPCRKSVRESTQRQIVIQDYYALTAFFQPEHFADLSLMRTIGFEPMFVERNLHKLENTNEFRECTEDHCM